ncbi:uncharacterized protein K452DRAFT_291347 [Aplosporella prunicola CBS 121167]|uniref:Cytochrome P450 n=1 Tax=Aplosporella prunicola CBS 121167 TaxID=1176127 RepID=A0A6A6B485_9PEZI|nr:uncharacterized protein K452DRAFT_291347 [Aplosporella prunicola CBS 121167]KAF2137767.1 hypothetical protein K452DRAFT_291347 [Aplosporella prunicola CBS 121167]
MFSVTNGLALMVCIAATCYIYCNYFSENGQSREQSSRFKQMAVAKNFSAHVCDNLTIFADLKGCNSLLNFRFNNQIGLSSPTSRLQARSKANARLYLAFGIDNAFTTTDSGWHKQFRTEAESLLNTPTGKWKSIAETAIKTTRRRLDQSEYPQNLACIVQIITMKMALQVFLQVDLSTTTDEQVELLASEVNRIWIASKDASSLEEWRHQDQIHAVLNNIVPDKDPLVPRENPMNLILPSYETMWRAVLCCILELHFRPHATKLYWQSTLQKFVHSPTTIQLKRDYPDGSAAMISKEALRLYPPTRRIYRELQDDSSGESQKLAADIEALHRDSKEWPGEGEANASKFWPPRWYGHNGRNTTFLSFGGGPFLCPARQDFGPRMLALLVGAFSTVVRDEWRVKGDHSSKIATEAPLDTGRDSYMSLQIEKK